MKTYVVLLTVQSTVTLSDESNGYDAIDKALDCGLDKLIKNRTYALVDVSSEDLDAKNL